MMRKGMLSLLLGLALLGIPPEAAAQGQNDDTPRNQAVITAPGDIPVNRPILLDASLSRIAGSDVRFLWFVAGQGEPISRTADAIYTAETPGILRFRLIVQSTVDEETQESQAVHEVTVYRRKIVLVADGSVPAEKVEAQVQSASGAALFVKVIRTDISALRSPDRFTLFLSEQVPAFRGADTVVLWTSEGNILPQALAAFQRARALGDIRNQSIAVVSGAPLGLLSEAARSPFAVLQPRHIVLLRPEALGALFASPDIPSFLEDARDLDLDVSVLDRETPPVALWRVLSLLTQFMLTRGITVQTVLLLLMLPLIATILSFLKQIVGIVTFGLFVPSIIALSFLALGWWVGLAVFLFIIIVGSLSRTIVYRLHILYIPKVAIIITIVSISLLLLLAVTTAYGITFSRDAVFVLLVMSSLAESFLTAKAEQGWLGASSGIVQTIGAALLCVFIVQWPFLQLLILAYPETILVTVVVNAIVGRYTGLRISEYIRFRQLLKHVGSEE